jgi:hypothetical protein
MTSGANGLEYSFWPRERARKRIADLSNPAISLRSQLFKRIEHFHKRSAKVFFVAGDDGEVVSAGGSRNVTVFNRHAPARPLQLSLLFGPNMRDRSVEAEDPSMQRSHKTSQPSLQRLPLSPLFTACLVGELHDDHRAGVAVFLFSLEPSYHARVAVALRGLTQYIGVQQPAHNLDRKYFRRRGGRSSMGTGQALSTFNQFGFDAMRRHIRASSSASKSTRKWSPGFAGTAAGTVNRRLESSVTIMVGYSDDAPAGVNLPGGSRERSQISYLFLQSTSDRQVRRRKYKVNLWDVP